MKRLVLSTLLLTILVTIAFALDRLLGEFNDVGEVRTAAAQFRREAALLTLRTRQLVPGIRHHFGADGEIHAHLFRTGPDGTISGPEADEPKPAKTILFIGGSTTETNEVREALRFPYLVGKLLTRSTHQEVLGLNLGVRGNTSHDSLNLLLNHPSVAHADIVVLMNNINDRLVLARRHGYWTELNDASDTSWANVKKGIFALARALWDYATYESNALFVLRFNLLSEDPWTGEHGGIKIDKSVINYSDRDFDRSKYVYRRSLAAFVDVARSLGKIPVLMTQPLGRPSPAQNAFNNVVRQVAADRAVVLIDLDADLPRDRAGLFFPDNIHANDAGSQAIAKIIATRLKRTLFLREGDQKGRDVNFRLR